MKQSKEIKVYITLIIIFFLFFFLSIYIQSCKKFEIERIVKLETGEVSRITTNSASIRGTILDFGESEIKQCGHCWSATKVNPDFYGDDHTVFLGINITTNFNSDLTDLLPGKIYSIRAYAISKGKITYGDKISFTTNNISLPIVTTVSISNISVSSARVTGLVASDGGATVTARGVCWSIFENPTISDDHTTDGSGTGSFASNITGLSQGTIYFVRAYATNSVGTAYGDELSFTTTIATPVVTTTAISSITDKSAISGGNVISDEGATVTTRGVCWSTSVSPTLSDSHTTDGSGTGEFTSTLTGLSPNTTYYVRAYATNSAGTAYGDEISFKTQGIVIISWQKSFGGSSTDRANFIQQTTDGGYIIAGESESNDGDVSGNHGGFDYWIVKLTSTGEIDWQKSLGGSGYDLASSIQQTTDGGYIVAGYSYSNDGDVSGNHGMRDYWIVKLTSTGDIDWQKSLGGSNDEHALFMSIQQTIDGGYIVSGSSKSNDGDVSGNHGDFDYWIVKLTSTGELEWQKSLGGSDQDMADFIHQTSNNGYIIAGSALSDDGNVSGHHESNDYWIVKLTSTGDIDWQKSLGGSSMDWAHSIQQTTDGGYIIGGDSESNDGDVSGNHGYEDIWIVKLTSTGELEWQKSLGGIGIEWGKTIQPTIDGGYIISGMSESNDGNVSGNHGGFDYWIVKLTSTGEIDWQKSLGGSSDDYAYSIQQTTDGGYIVAGYSYSNDGDVSGNHGNGDYWIVKIVGD